MRCASYVLVCSFRQTPCWVLHLRDPAFPESTAGEVGKASATLYRLGDLVKFYFSLLYVTIIDCGSFEQQQQKGTLIRGPRNIE